MKRNENAADEIIEGKLGKGVRKITVTRVLQSKVQEWVKVVTISVSDYDGTSSPQRIVRVWMKNQVLREIGYNEKLRKTIQQQRICSKTV